MSAYTTGSRLGHSKAILQNHNKVICVMRFGDDPTRTENQFWNAAPAALYCLTVNLSGGLQILSDPGVDPGGIELCLTDQFNGFYRCCFEASGEPAVAGLKCEHPVFEGRKHPAASQSAVDPRSAINILTKSSCCHH
jgi:hypothetical protein